MIRCRNHEMYMNITVGQRTNTKTGITLIYMFDSHGIYSRLWSEGQLQKVHIDAPNQWVFEFELRWRCDDKTRSINSNQ